MRLLKTFVVLALVAAAAWWLRGEPTSPALAPGTTMSAPASGLPAFLPPEAQRVVGLIARGGPFPYRRDGIVFQNREGRLPSAPRGTYHEYTVPTPGASDRGARRIITAGQPPAAYWYTDDHYRTFRRFEVTR